jgi:hypothetical protein
MKKSLSITIIVFLLLLQLALAQTLKIQVIQYDPDTGVARIQLSNKGEDILNDVEVAIDDNPYESLDGRIRPNIGVILTRTIEPGTHMINVKTSEKQFTQEINFGKSSRIVEQEKEQVIQQRAEQQLQPKPERTKPPLSRTAKHSFFLASLFVAIAFIIIYVKRTKTKKVTPKPQLQRPVFRRRYIRPAQRTPVRPIQTKKILRPQTQPLRPQVARKQQIPGQRAPAQKQAPKQVPQSKEAAVLAKLRKIKQGSTIPKEKKQDVFKKLSKLRKQPQKKDVFKQLKKIKKS